MRKPRKPLMFVAVVALVALGTTAVYAGPWFGGKKAERVKTFVQWKVDDVLDELDATDDQRAQIAPLADQLVDSAMNRFADREAFREELLALWQAPTPDTKQARETVFARVEAARALGHEAIDAAARAHGVLTPKQRVALADQLEERARDRQRTPEERAERAQRFTGYVLDEIVDVADADEAQAARLKGLADGLVKTGLAQMGDHGAMRAEARALWTAAKADPVKAKALLDARVDVWKGMAAEAIDAAAEAHGVLDAGQRDAVADAIRKRARRWR